jgi:hypothetical protein
MIYKVSFISMLRELFHVSTCYSSSNLLTERDISCCKCECMLQIILFSYLIGADTLDIVHVTASPFMNLAVYKPT